MATSTVVSFLAMAVAAMVVLQAAGATPPPPSPPPPYVRPTNCAATLIELINCAPFLTIGTVISGPPPNCCAPLREVLSTPASICLCHAIGGDINEFLGINIDPIRLALLPVACWAIVPPQLSAMCFVGPVPPISTIPPRPPSPPVTPPSPPPPVTPPPSPMPPSPPMRLLP